MMLNEVGRSVPWLAQKIHCQRRNVYDIFNRASIDVVLLLKISLALEIDFFAYFSETLNDKTKFASPRTCCFTPNDEIRIGDLIRNKLDEDGRKAEWLAQMVNRQRNNIYNVLNNKTSIDTALLLAISKALKTNFFEYFSRKYEIMLSETEIDSNYKCVRCIGL